MAKGFGIAAIICAILAIFIPLGGIAISGIAIVFAIIGALSGDKAFATATSLIAGINTFFLSPSITLTLKTTPVGTGIGIFLFVCAAAPIAAIVGRSIYDSSQPINSGGKPIGERKPSQSPHSQGHPQTSVGVSSAPIRASHTRNDIDGASGNDGRPPLAYDERKWRALVRFDDEIAAAARQARGLGAHWESELARSYLRLNDKSYLTALLDKVTKEARGQSA